MDGVVGQLGQDILKNSSIIKPVLDGNLWYGINTYKIKKYADKLKEIVCLLIGCTREQLEDREFKEKELGEEWNIWIIIPNLDHNLFDGNCQLQEAIFSSSDEAKEYVKKHKIINVLDIEEKALTPRKLLQLLGTQCGRQIIHPNIWINALFADYECNKSEWLAAINSNWIITDVRFPNEAEAIKQRGGIVIRVNRPINLRFPKLWKLYTSSNKFVNKTGKFLAWLLGHDKEMCEKLSHPSETALDDYEFGHVIENDGSIEELVEKVKQLNLV